MPDFIGSSHRSAIVRLGALAWFPTELLPPISIVFEKLFAQSLPAAATSSELQVLCPLHDETRPSFSLNIGNDTFYCFSANCIAREGGGVLKLIQLARSCDAQQAKNWLYENGLMRRPRTVDFWNDAPLPTLYSYFDSEGALVYQVGRKQVSPEHKEIQQRRPKPNGDGWLYSLRGITRVPYNLPDLLRCAAQAGTVYVVEGEKNANDLRSAFNVCVTTNAQGAKWAWPQSWAEHFRGVARVVVLADNDPGGIAHAEQVAAICALTVPNTRLVGALPDTSADGGDISDWLADGHTFDELQALVDGAPVAAPYQALYPADAVSSILADLTDTGNGHWFKACVGEDVRWIRDSKVWRAWDGKRWTDRIEEHVFSERAVKQMRLAVQHASITATERETFEEWVTRSSSMTLRKNMLEAAKALLLLESAALDSKTTLLNMQNGILNLETFELGPHDRDMYFTKLAPIAYKPEADCINWLAWLDEAMDGDIEMVEYVQRIFGESLIGKAGLRRMYFCYGPHGTGKTTITKVLREMLGEFAGSIDFSSVTHRDRSNGSAASPDVARMSGLRTITAVESRDSDKLDAARLKQLMGGDAVIARNLYQGVTEFVLQATLFFSGNERPEVQADDSFWSKLKMLPFKHRFERQDVNFFERILRPELPGIFAWSVDGLRKLAADNFRMIDPAAVQAETLAYREDANPLQRFLEEACQLSTPASNARQGDYSVSKADLRKAFTWWASTQGLRAWGERAFSNRMRHVPGVSEIRFGTDRTRMWTGLCLTQATRNAVAVRTRQDNDLNENSDF